MQYTLQVCLPAREVTEGWAGGGRGLMSALMSWVPAQMRSWCHLQFPTHQVSLCVFSAETCEAYGEVRVSPSQARSCQGL